MTTTFEQWLTGPCGLAGCKLETLPGDASFRRYVRVRHADRVFIAMDASLEKQSCFPFVAIADSLREYGLRTPTVFASDLTQGFLLLEDFGNRLLLDELTPTNASHYYRQALDALHTMQHANIQNWTLKPFTHEFMRNELTLFREWFLEKHLGLTLSDSTQKTLDDSFNFLASSASQQPQFFMHRDYHSANLMILPENEIGILDFQDAFMGPVTYDLVSLLRDCYIAWPESFVYEMAIDFYEKIQLPHVSADEFLKMFDLMGIQRHLKALLTFSRKYRRDHNANYLQHIPRTVQYVLNASEKYPETKKLHHFLTHAVVEKCVE